MLRYKLQMRIILTAFDQIIKIKNAQVGKYKNKLF